MKSVKPFAIFLLFLATFFISCSPQDNLYTTSEIISRGDWTVAYLYTGQDKTGEFEKSTLKFTADGKLTYTNNNQSLVGSWSMIRDEKGYDLLTIDITGQNNLVNLTTSGVWRRNQPLIFLCYLKVKKSSCVFDSYNYPSGFLG